MFRRRWKLVLTALGSWVLPAVLSALEGQLFADQRGIPLPLSHILPLELLRFLPFGLTVPAVFWLSGSFAVGDVRSLAALAARAAFHNGCALGYGALYTLSFTAYELHHPLRPSAETSFAPPISLFFPRAWGTVSSSISCSTRRRAVSTSSGRAGSARSRRPPCRGSSPMRASTP